MPDLALRFDKDMLVCDGAMGTMLHRLGMPAGECAEYLNVLDPEMVREVHRYYRLAGANIATSNTFGGTRNKLRAFGVEDRLEEFNVAGVRLAQSLDYEHVVADVGPCGLVMQPLGKATFDQVFAQYFEQVTALAKAGPEAILIETMTDIADARCALLAAQAACDLPVIVSCTFNERGVMELSGTDPETAATVLEAAGASVVGLNCGFGPAQARPILQRMARATSLPLIVQPNAGLPEVSPSGEVTYPLKPDEMGDWARAFREDGAQIIGGCCGSTPAHIGMIAAEIAALPVVSRPDPHDIPGTVVASARRRVRIGGGSPCRLLGERINPTGKPRLAAQLREGSLGMVREFAAAQEHDGAELLDVNVGAPDVDEKALLEQAVTAVCATSSLPLSIDTSDQDALERALRVYPGRALVNSCTGEEASYSSVLPLAKRYGAAVVVLALDENGIPDTLAGRLEIAERVRRAAASYGLSDDDLVFDMLTMTAATDEHAPDLTLDGVRELSARGLNSILGVSNVSHGLPDRPLLNAAFLDAAIQAGLTVAIANPNNAVMAETHATATAARMDGTGLLEEARAHWHELYREAVARGSEALDDHHGDQPAEQLDARTRLAGAVRHGNADAAPALVDEVVAEGVDPQTIIPDILTPTLQEVGDAFERGETFLPQMIVAADAMKAAVDQVRTHLPACEAGRRRGRVLFCTVQGDIHSIGKDICVSLLESQGFEVFDLGVDVPPERVVEQAREHEVDCVCLSALMTTTLPSMKRTVELVGEQLSGVECVVGGAVVTEDWARSISAHYSADAPSCALLIGRLLQGRESGDSDALSVAEGSGGDSGDEGR
ncbi:MAG: homocysteine S-methyltransferase family protein [Coriobacteriales bacterium]